MMPLPPRLFPGDEEMGKRNDDHKPGARSPLGIAWQHGRLPHGPHRRNLKRVGLGLVALICVYYFIKNMPTDLENPRPRPRFDYTQAESGSAAGGRSPAAQVSVQKPGSEAIVEPSQYYFSGPIKFYQLAATLQAASKTKGSEPVNRNVVYALDIHIRLSADCL